MQDKLKTVGSWLLMIVILVMIYSMVSSYMRQGDHEVYSDLINAIKAGDVSKLEVGDNVATVTLVDGKRSKNRTRQYSVQIPSVEVLQSDVGYEMSSQIAAGTLTYEVAEPGIPWWSIIMPVIAFGGIIFFFIMMMRQNGSRAGGFTKSRAKLNIDESRKIGFEDVAGAVEEKEELEELVEFLKNPDKFIALGARIPKGVLLVGPPGTGKTLLARAVAGEAGVPFFSISGSDFVELYVGVGASRVRDLFEQAKKNRPCIIFIDEIDAVGRKRGAGMGGGHDEREQTLNQLLVEMDGFGANEGIIMIAATNRPDILDPALLRPGRFDRQVVVNVPDVKGREDILKVHCKNKPLAAEVDLARIARVTAGYTGADLENLMNEASIFAARRNKIWIENQDIEEANIKVMMGAAKKSRIMTDKDKKLTAYHEAGHAVLTKLVDQNAKVHQVSIIPRGRAGGYTMHVPEEDSMCQSRRDMLNDIIVLLGGRVAEKLVLDDISTGASNDIKRATELARSMVAQYGMSDALGPVCYDNEEEVFLGRDYGHSKAYSEETASEIDHEVKEILVAQFEQAESLLKAHMDILERVAKALLEVETIDEQQFETLFNNA